MTRLKLLTPIIALVVWASAPAEAFTLVNEDAETYEVEFVEGEGDSTVADIVELAPDYMIEDACENGCNIHLNNGVQGQFKEGQSVVIRGGKFVVVD